MNKYSRIALFAHALLWVATTASAQEAKLPRIGFVAGAGGYPKMAITNQAFLMAWQPQISSMAEQCEWCSEQQKAT